MRNKPNEWQQSEIHLGDSIFEYNLGTGEIIIICNDSCGWDAETFRALYLEMERKGMYDG